MSVTAMLVALRAGHLASGDLLDTLDPELRDLLRATLAHRAMDADAFVVAALELFALRAADAAWAESLAGLSGQTDPYALLLGRILHDAASRLERDAILLPKEKDVLAAHALTIAIATSIETADEPSLALRTETETRPND